MKKKFALIITCFQLCAGYAQSLSWVTTSDTTSIINYSFASPQIPTKMDTLGFKLYSCTLDTLVGFQVLEIKYPPCDSSNSVFINELQLTNGDTLQAITNILFSTANSVVLSTQVLDLSNGFSGLEYNFKYNILNQGRAVISFERFFYKKDFLVTFKVTGFESDLTNLIANKNQFFNSISF